ncbi:MAG: hypothetical protein Q4G63_03840 [Bacteroidia bacterium]|nr:hypothetical protein [Bacteroidia bacterium]
MRRSIAVLIFTVSLLIASCVNEAPRFTIPYSRVFFQIDVNGLDSDLSFFGSKTFTQGRTIGEQIGYGGLLVFRTTEGDIFAYDLCCPYEDNREVKVKPTDNGKAVCSKCGSVYITMYGLGTAESGSSNQSLQTYTVRKNLNREGVFVITN